MRESVPKTSMACFTHARRDGKHILNLVKETIYHKPGQTDKDEDSYKENFGGVPRPEYGLRNINEGYWKTTKCMAFMSTAYGTDSNDALEETHDNSSAGYEVDAVADTPGRKTRNTEHSQRAICLSASPSVQRPWLEQTATTTAAAVDEGGAYSGSMVAHAAAVQQIRLAPQDEEIVRRGTSALVKILMHVCSRNFVTKEHDYWKRQLQRPVPTETDPAGKICLDRNRSQESQRYVSHIHLRY